MTSATVTRLNMKPPKMFRRFRYLFLFIGILHRVGSFDFVLFVTKKAAPLWIAEVSE